MKSLSHVQLFVTPWTIAYQAPLSMEFSRQEYWSGLPFPSPGDLHNPGIKPGSPALEADALQSEPSGKLKSINVFKKKRRKKESKGLDPVATRASGVLCLFPSLLLSPLMSSFLLRGEAFWYQSSINRRGYNTCFRTIHGKHCFT